MSEREPWIAVKVGVPDSGKVIHLPTDAARWGLIVLWCRAKRQTPSGVFKSEKVARTLLGQYGRHFPRYIDGGFLHRAPVVCPDEKCQGSYAGLSEPAIAVHSWRDHQRDHALRQLSYRVGDTVSDVESDSESDFHLSTVSSLLSKPTEGGLGETDPVEAYYALTTRFPRGKVLDWLNDLGERHGRGRTSAALAQHYAANRDLGTLLGRVQNALRAEDHAAEKKERADEEVRLRKKRAPDPLMTEIRAALVERYPDYVSEEPA